MITTIFILDNRLQPILDGDLHKIIKLDLLAKITIFLCFFWAIEVMMQF